MENNANLSLNIELCHSFPLHRVERILEEGNIINLFSAQNSTTLYPYETRYFSTGIKIKFPPRTQARITPISRVIHNKGIYAIEAIITSENYSCDELEILVTNVSEKSCSILKGQRIAHLTIVPSLSLELKIFSSKLGTSSEQ